MPLPRYFIPYYFVSCIRIFNVLAFPERFNHIHPCRRSERVSAQRFPSEFRLCRFFVRVLAARKERGGRGKL